MSTDEKHNGTAPSGRRAYELLRESFDTVEPDVPPFDPDPALITHLDRRQRLPHIRWRSRSRPAKARESAPFPEASSSGERTGSPTEGVTTD